MGDRTTPMKFGPEWLRNLSCEPTSTGSGAQSTTPPIRPVTATASASSNTSATTKVQLAKLRYGREEMLALYDQQAAEAPLQLKTIEVLYHSRGKPPYALNSNFEEDSRESGGIRNNPPVGAMSADRYGPGRGRGFGLSLGRGSTIVEGRGRARGFVRQTSLGRAPSWHNGAQRSYPSAPDDDPNPSRGLWNNGNGNGITPPGIRPSAEQADWANKMAYRKPRQNHTNWRQQHNREEGEEWRSDSARRGQEKWEREWPERAPQEKGWSTNRRQWGGDADELPEWAVENSEACGGTFDSSGAFHGYSNDDSNIPKAQDSSHALARSQTHGSFAQDFKQFAKRRFDAIEVKFKKSTDESTPEEIGNPPSATTEAANANSGQIREISKIENIRNKLASNDEPDLDSPDMQEEAAALPASRDESKIDFNKDRSASAQRNDMLRRTEERESSSEQGSYKSVMMATNNNHLRQKHQNIGAPSNVVQMPHRFQQMIEARQKMESDFQNDQKQQENKLVDDMLDMHLSEELQAQLLNSTTQSAGIPNSVNSIANQMPSPGMQIRINNPLMTPGIGINQLQTSSSQNQQSPENNMIQPIGITNSVLNASLGLPIGTGSNMNMPMTSMPPPPIPNPGVLSSNLQGMGTSNMQNMQVGGIQSRMQVPGMPTNSFQPAMPGNNNMQGLQPNMQTSAMNNSNMQSASGIPAYQGVAVGTNSLFMQGAPNNMQSPGEMGNQGQQNMYTMHRHSLQPSPSQGSFNPASLYSNMMQPPPAVPHPNLPLVDHWYYEDPNKTIQGPFTSKEMYGWYHAGFFTPDLMVRRACESVLMPLANYGPMPFGPSDIMPPQFNQSATRYELRQQSIHDSLITPQQQAGLGAELEALWSMREPSANDMMWIRQPVQMPHSEEVKTLLNNLSMYFWDQPTGNTKSMMPETIKDMKTEDDILAQMRASQAEPATQNLTFICDATVNPEEVFTAGTNIAPNLEELQKLIGSDVHGSPAPEPPAAAVPAVVASRTHDVDHEKPPEKADSIPEVSAKQQTAKATETKPAKHPAKVEEKPKIKDPTPKAKAKKVKEEKKEESPETKKEEKKTIEKRLDEPSPPKNKREDKVTKKDLEKEKKEWLKDGFTIVKGAEKKDSKKKEKEEARAAEEAEKKRKEEEKRVLEAEKNKTPEPVTRRQQLEQGQRQSQSQEQPPKKAPWSAQSAQTGRDGLALSDIQRLEREKKLEQMKEQQQMMQVIAQQQAAAAQREQQEIQAGQLGWAKKKQANSPPGQTLAEIQAEARKQAAAMVAAAAAAAAAREETLSTPPPVNVTPWGATNGAGFWDSPSSSSASGREGATEPSACLSSTTTEIKSKKKVTVVVPAKKEPSPPKKEVSPSADFDTWCTQVLSNWRDAGNIDIPTFVAFLRDIESPYEVKDYVKCYLGDTKEANDFARQFLERRSRMLRVGMVTPSDDLCSPAAALTPRTNSGSDYTEVKSKGNKKTKKNKMLKVDARILGFSVTASEDRINVGDIDTA